MSDLVVYATVLAALGTGLLAGFVFAFSNVVMPSLSRQEPQAGMEVMQTINLVVENRLFSGLLAVTTLVVIVLAVVAVLGGDPAGRTPVIVGSLSYLLVGVGVTVAVNVPLNRRLALVDTASQEGHALWRRFLARWCFWNHVRTAGSAFASLAFSLALIQM